MRRAFLVAIPALVLMVPGSVPTLHAQATKTARGTVTAIAGDTITVKVQDRDLSFSVDSKTEVEASGAGHKAAAAQSAGKPGPRLTDVLKNGQAVEVSYHDMGGTLHASKIRAIVSAGGGSMSEAAPAAKVASGTVRSVAADSLTVSGPGGKSMTFAIDASTKVIGRGAGTKTAAKGGRAAISDLVSSGDRVSISYHEMNGMMHAAEVRVTAKGKMTK